MFRRLFLKRLVTLSLIVLGFPSRVWAKAREACYTGGDVSGPYYRAGAPVRNDLTLGYSGPKGESLKVKGQVFGSDCRTPLKNAVIELWQSDPNGSYDMGSDKFLFRATVKTSHTGEYAFSTFIPGYYIDQGMARPKHIHYIVTAPGHSKLVTQLYFLGDKRLQDDRFVKANNGLKRALALQKDTMGEHHINFDIYLKEA